MNTYISLMTLSAKGLSDLHGSSERRALSEERVSKLGGQSKAFFAMLGKYDFLQIFEMPDNATMMEYLLTARRDGFVTPLVLPAFDVPTYGKILKNIKPVKGD